MFWEHNQSVALTTDNINFLIGGNSHVAIVAAGPPGVAFIAYPTGFACRNFSQGFGFCGLPYRRNSVFLSKAAGEKDRGSREGEPDHNLQAEG